MTELSTTSVRLITSLKLMKPSSFVLRDDDNTNLTLLMNEHAKLLTSTVLILKSPRYHSYYFIVYSYYINMNYKYILHSILLHSIIYAVLFHYYLGRILSKLRCKHLAIFVGYVYVKNRTRSENLQHSIYASCIIILLRSIKTLREASKNLFSLVLLYPV